jgi:SAM-dependent methyltransferase
MSRPIFRIDEILEYCKGKSVLHFGYVQHSVVYEEYMQRDEWAHAWMARVASRVVGVDYLPQDIEDIQKKYGYEGYFGDAMNLDSCKLNEKFDVVVCGELIEHLTNPGLMLEGVKRFMKDDGILIVTTPNVWAKTYLRQMKKYDNETWVNPEHVLWYSHFTLTNTMERHGYDKVSYDYYFDFTTRKSYFNVQKGLMGKARTIVRTIRMKRSTKETQLG